MPELTGGILQCVGDNAVELKRPDHLANPPIEELPPWNVTASLPPARHDAA
jgi:hypothetical protein